MQQAVLEQISMQQTSLQETVLQEAVLQKTLLQQGLDLTLYGMGIVFVFLALLVVCTLIMSAVVDRFFREPQLDLVTAPAQPASKSGVSPKTLAIIQAAIHEHRAHTHK